MLKSFVHNAPMDAYTTYRIGGRAKYLAPVYDIDGLLRACELSDNRVVLGRGSKVLVSDKGFDGVVILMRFSSVRFTSKDHLTDNSGGIVYAEAGVSLPALSRIYAEKGLGGMEWASGIPGNIGGALKLNAGAYGGDMSKVVIYADVLRKGRTTRLSNQECGFGYRHSGFYPGDIILGAGLRVKRGDAALISELIAGFRNKRNAAQPKGLNCGSVFKAAERPAYAYIEECGLKGLSVGDAVISEKHGNFILNRGFAKARDVYTLIRTAKAEVFFKFGVRLKEEVIYIGEF